MVVRGWLRFENRKIMLLSLVFQMFRVEDTCRYHILAGGRRVSYDITDVNLTVIIALTFLMTTPQAKTLRMWFIEKLFKMKNLDIPLYNIGQDFILN